MTRYKIRMPTDEAFEQARAALEARAVRIFVASARRRILSTGALAADTTELVTQLGGTIAAETAYDGESR